MNANKPYLIDAVIGNSRMLATLGRTGRLYRLWWPHIDLPQHVDAIRTGIRLDEPKRHGSVSWFDDPDCGWSHEAAYVPSTNILRVTARSNGLPIAVESDHYAVPGRDVLIRHYRFRNTGSETLSFSFVQYSSFLVAEHSLYNTTAFHEETDSLVHFRHHYYFAVASPRDCSGFQSGSAWQAAEAAELNGNGIDMKPDGAVLWRIEGLAPGETASVPVYIAAGETEADALRAMREAKERTAEEWFNDTADYWRHFVAACAPCPSDRPAFKELYERSLLTFKLMSDEQTGSIIAAPEFDETFSRCGGYAYCWGRDAAFITTALDRSGLYELSDRFYDWALTSQSPDGSWQQRHYHDGSLAPSWGLQIDEGASILWGMWEHYRVRQDGGFAERVWPAVRKGADFLLSFLDPETGLPKPSMDLWEERSASHTYSAAAVYGGLQGAASFAQLRGEAELAAAWRRAAARIAAVIEGGLWNEERGSLYRALNLAVGKEQFEEAAAAGKTGSVTVSAKGYETFRLKYDPVIDISLLGVSVPFGAMPAGHDYMRRTADAVEQALTVPGVGGIKRYENDHYIGGNPWILTTIWLAHYRLQCGEIERADALLQWAVNHRTELGLLPEQVDKNTGETAWVVPLTWSHAMFVLALFMLKEAKASSGAESAAQSG
ncbi:glycoside hydrolase family 15 protein [Paenibacillus thailandensis]|uniref:Glycoside hydrolase family 15 protein n=1 Tax=Paenibacillus thailandensis TaxID=393250 RepID=A0ABW5R058_9BACL